MKNRIYTSYWAMFHKFDPLKFHRIQISRSYPRGIIPDGKLNILMPSERLLSNIKNGTITKEEYRVEYINQLDSIPNLIEILEKMLSLTSRNIVLLCYESPDKFCHRHILADYVNAKSRKIKITEYDRLCSRQ